MSLKDGDDAQWSSNSCDDWDLEENEARLYSMVYHNSNTYDDEPTTAQSSNSALILSADNNQNSSTGNQKDVSESSHNSVTDEQPPTTSNVVQENLHQSKRSKASRLDQVNNIIDFADKGDKVVTDRSRPNARNKRDKVHKDMSSKREKNNTEVPKTASLYFQNLKKTLNNVEYFQSVEPRLSRPFDQANSKPSAGTSSFSNMNPAANYPQLPGRAAVTNFSFTTPGHTAFKDVPLFCLDDRLFPNAPKNASRQEIELSKRLFSNKPKNVPVDRDRHNHLFNQLPFVPIQALPSIPIAKTKNSRRRKQKLRAKRRLEDMNLSSCPPVQIIPSLQILPTVHRPQTDSNIVVPAIITKLNSILNRIGSNPVDLNDDPIEIIQPTNVALKDSKEIINVDLSINEVIDLDSDSADSIVVITPPSKTPPPVISLSDDETATKNTLHPLLETEHVENSFDFLDSSDDLDFFRNSQVSVFTNLISNSGSKESLLDHRLFQVAEVTTSAAASVPDNETQPSKMSSLSKQASAGSVQPVVQQVEEAPRVDSVPHPAVVIAMPVLIKQPVALIIDPRSPQKETVLNLDNLGVSAVVNVDDESSHSNESVEPLSNSYYKSAHVPSKSTTKTNLILNVQEKSYIDLEINNLLIDNSDNFQEVALAPYERELSPDSRRKRKRDQRDEGSPTKSARKKRGKKAREKSRHQLQDFLQKRTGMMAFTYTKVEGTNSIARDELRPRYPTKWTREMRHFYTDSWGGENYDVQEVQRSMPADQSLWRISWEDRRGPVPQQGTFRRARCFNCSRIGHPASICPEPRRITKCHMCGEAGHAEPNCPNKICLQCGRPCSKYSNGCWECRHVPHDLCTKCIWKHDKRTPCMDVRRNPITPGTEPQPLGDLREQLQSKRSRHGHQSQGGRRAHSQPRVPRLPWQQGGQAGYKERERLEDYDPRHRGFRRSRP